MRIKKKQTILFGILAIFFVLAVFYFKTPGAILGTSDVVWMPNFYTVQCDVVHNVCYPENPDKTVSCGSSASQTFDQSVPSSGASYWCGPPTLPNGDYFSPCTVSISKSGISWLVGPVLNDCDTNGYDCHSINPTSSSPSSQYYNNYLLSAGRKLYLKPGLGSSIKFHMQAEMYGLDIVSSTGLMPFSTDGCNIAKALSQGIISTYKSSPDYTSIIAAGEITPQTRKFAVVSGYSPVLYNTAIIIRDGASWWVKEPGVICPIEQDTLGKYIVTTPCKTDNSVACIPNLLNCDQYGKLKPDYTGKACTPGTVIGGSGRYPLPDGTACHMICDSTGNVKYTDCISIPQCSQGLVLNNDYECVQANTITERDKCELKGGTWAVEYTSAGQVKSESCDMTPKTPFWLWIVGGVLGLALLILFVKIINKRR